MLENYKDILNLKELCEAIDIGKNTAYKLLNTGEIKSVRIGKVYKIPKVWVIDYILNKNELK